MNQLKPLKYWLLRPYVYEQGKLFQFSICIIIALIVFIVIYILKPFGIENLDNDLLIYCAGYGFVNFGVLFFFYFVINPLFPNFFSNATWNVAKELGTIIGCVMTIGFFSWYYNSLVQKGGLDSENFTLKAYMGYAFTISIFPVVIYVFIGEWYLRFNRRGVSESIMLEKTKLKKQHKTDTKNQKITLYAENQKDYISFFIDHLVYVTSEGNYISFFTKNNDNHLLKETVLRGKLNYVEKELASFPEIIRCHKSYIINSSLVVNLSGNARGFFLHFNELDQEIPVSRKFSRLQLEKLLPV